MLPRMLKLFRFKGPGDGQGEMHRVLETTARQVLTSSIFDEPQGHTWEGTPEQFEQQFELVGLKELHLNDS